MIVRPATADDIAAVIRATGSEDPVPTVIAWVGEIDGEIVGIGGFAILRGHWRAFCDLTPAARRHKMTIARAAKRAMAHARLHAGRYVYAEPDPDEPGALRWLKSLGFSPDIRSGGALYRWHR